MLNSAINSSKFKLAPWVVKRHEDALGRSYFYNAKTKMNWSSELSTGIVVSALDGSLTVEEIVDILAENNPEISANDFRETFVKIFNKLKDEEFIVDES